MILTASGILRLPGASVCGPCDAGTCGTCARLGGLTQVYVGQDGVCAFGHRGPADRVIVMGRLATALLNGRVSDGMALDLLVLQAGCTPEGARAHVARWQETRDDIDDEYRLERADYTEG